MVRRAANVLNDQRTLRNVADYDVRSQFSIQDAVNSVAFAEEVLRILDALTPVQRNLITDAMKLYEQGIGDVTWRP